MIKKISEEAISPRNLFGADGQKAFYRVKPPQRRYKWRTKQAREFLKDITKAYKKDKKSALLSNLYCLYLEDHKSQGQKILDFS